MRILINALRYFGDSRGGGNRVAWDTAAELHTRGHDVVLVCQGTADTPADERIEGVRILRYQLPRWDIDPYARHQRATSRILRRELRGWAPDLIWGNNPLQHAGCMRAFPNAPCVYTMHSPVRLELLAHSESPGPLLRSRAKLAESIERACVDPARRVIVLSAFSRQLVREIYGERAFAKTTVSPGWVDTTKFRIAEDRESLKRTLGWRTGCPAIFTLRRLVTRMGVPRLIDAVQIVKQHGHRFHLYIGGEGDLREVLTQQIARTGLTDDVSLLGGVPEGRLPGMYAAADLFVMPTLALEGFGIPALEAMASGTAVIATPIGALPETVGALEPAWLTRDNSAAAIADALRKFLRGEMPPHSPEAIRRFAVERYSAETAMKSFCDAALAE